MTAQRVCETAGPQDCYEAVADCPTCGSPLAGDETFCLQCGTRLVPEEDPEPRWSVPIAIVIAIAVLAVAGVLLALEQVESDAEREATKPAVVVEPPEPPSPGTGPTEVAEWPDGVAAFTVALARLPDEATARARADAVVDAGVPAGVLDTSAYPSLEPGGWLLFAGRYETPQHAAEEAARYAAAGFPDAQPVLVSTEAAPAGNG